MFGLSSRREEKLEPVEVEEKFSKGKYAYLSYIRKDKQNTYKLARAIENQGFDIWVDEWDIPLDEDWSSQYEKRIKDSGLLLLVLNQSSLKSKYVRSEIAVALEKGKPILPVLIGESELPVQLKSWRCIPVELNKEKYHIDNIVRALKVQLRN